MKDPSGFHMIAASIMEELSGTSHWFYLLCDLRFKL